MSALGLASRVSPVQTAPRSGTRDAGGPLQKLALNPTPSFLAVSVPVSCRTRAHTVSRSSTVLGTAEAQRIPRGRSWMVTRPHHPHTAITGLNVVKGFAAVGRFGPCADPRSRDLLDAADHIE